MAKQQNRQLTPKQRKFCKNIALGMNYEEAYLGAYSEDGKSINNAKGMAYRLMQDERIRKEVENLSQAVTNKVAGEIVNDRVKKIEILWAGIEECRLAGDHSGVARYMDILNKMDGEYVNINKNIDNQGGDIVNLSTEELKRILG